MWSREKPRFVAPPAPSWPNTGSDVSLMDQEPRDSLLGRLPGMGLGQTKVCLKTRDKVGCIPS
jgi:hypothetical protein